MAFVQLIFVVAFIAAQVCGSITNFHTGLEFNSVDNEIEAQAMEKKWWETASLYQIYPRSFQDSDGDGIGDLRGIMDRLPYLKEIGITAAWISPIFVSPMVDFGYDIADFTKIDPMFGTMEDLEALVQKAEQVGVKILLDFVPNHTSDESEWFQKSIERDPEFEDFYVWHPGKIVNGVRQPPSNWLSVFRGSAWEWNDKRQEYYLHQFAKKQVDLNYRNPKVREYMTNILLFWLNKGISGFRIDAVRYTFEAAPDDEGNYLDEPRNELITDPEENDYLEHLYTVDQPETLDLVYEWRKVIDDFQELHGGEERILLTEAYSPVDVLMKYYGNETADGAHMPFNFLMITFLNKESDAFQYAEVINTWLSKLPEGRTPNWVLGNHDNNRVGSRMGADRIDMLNMLLLTLPGCSVTYQGEEIGMTDVWISWEDTVDPQACNSNPSLYESKSRDPCRTPFQWDDEKNSGFSSGDKTWLPISDLYPTVNVKRERGISYSHLNIYIELQGLRSEKTMRNGDATVKAVSNTVLAIRRSLHNDYTYITLMNIMDDVEIVNLNSAFADLPLELEYTLVTQRSLRRKGDKAYTNQILLLPKEAVVLRTTKKGLKKNYYYTYNEE